MYRGSRFSELWRLIRLVAVGVGAFLAFAALIECVQAYQVLYNVHPYLGFCFLMALLGGVVWAVVYFTLSIIHRPVVLVPPPRCDFETARPRELKRHARYLIAVLERLADNSFVPAESRAVLLAEATAMKNRLGTGVSSEVLIESLRATVEQVIGPAIAPLDAEAERRVRCCVRDTMLGVTVSPWRSMDLLVVLYRNGQMILEVSQLYHGRPRLRDQLHIFGDVMKIAATVQFLNIGSRLIENMTSWIPMLGRFADDIAQGIGAGLFTSVTGYAAIDRCRSFQGWDEAAARAGLGGQLKQFLADLKGVVGDTIMPALRSRIEASNPDDAQATKLMDRMRAGIGEAIDRTCETMDSCVRKPVEVGYRGVATTGAALWGGLRKVGVGTTRAVGWTGGHAWKAAAGTASVIGRFPATLRKRRRVKADDEDAGKEPEE
jgi:uncharacterized membrane protein YcjF (UPF0283 family)